MVVGFLFFFVFVSFWVEAMLFGVQILFSYELNLVSRDVWLRVGARTMKKADT
jgi:hypothetical protein